MTIKSPVCLAVACVRGTAAKLTVDSRLATTAVNVMTFEATRTRGASSSLRSDHPQRPQAKPRVVDVAGDILSPHVLGRPPKAPGVEMLMKNIELLTCSRFEGLYLSGCDVRSHRNAAQHAFPVREPPRPRPHPV